MDIYAETMPRCVVAGVHAIPNEDDFATGEDMVAVFDGLGGHPGSEKASTLAAKAVREFCSKTPYSDGCTLRALEDARVKLLAARAAEIREHQRMTCTAVLARVRPNGDGEVSWCGDSRAFILMTNGILRRITEDHDYFYDLNQKGKMRYETARAMRTVVANSQTKSDAWRGGQGHAKRGFTKNHLMFSDLHDGDIDTVAFTLATGEMLILTTDGIHDNMTQTEMQEMTFETPKDVQAIAHTLVQESARIAVSGDVPRGHPDDLTCATLML